VSAKLRIAVDAAQGRKEPVEHVLLHGPPGLGKTSLAYIALPETFSGPSRRGVGVPIILSSALFFRRGRTVGFWRVRCIDEN